MRKLTLWMICFGVGVVNAQNGVVLTKGTVPLHNVFEPDSISKIDNGIYTIHAAYPIPAGIDPVIKYQANQRRERLSNTHFPQSIKRAALTPQVEMGFSGAQNEGTPNDNNMAINNDSMVISVLNTFIRVYSTSGKFLKNWSLEFFPKDPKNTQADTTIGALDRSYDPKVVFDPVANRFIIVYLEGSLSSDTRIIVAFSKTNNPLDGWNVYQLNGSPFGGTYWTDYPMIAINGEDLFITVNILKDNTDWRDGFTESVIWQLPKIKGYSADTMKFNLWSNIKHNGKSIWSICPVQDAFQPGKEGLYLLSVRPGDASNDTVFLHSINHNYSHGNPEYSYKILKSDKPYGLPPVAPQKQAGFRLQTNDARVLGAFYVNNKIQYVQTSMNTINGKSSIYHGIIQFPDHPLPEVKANIISNDTLDFAYPTIVSAGNEVFGKQSLITFSHSGENTYPGSSIVYFDNDGEYSNLVMFKEGEGYINSFIVDTAERWGDYTAIQRRYNAKNEYWVVGSYGKSTNAVGTWVSKISVNDPELGIQHKQVQKSDYDAYPNPVKDVLTLPFEIKVDSEVSITLVDNTGKLILTLSEYQSKGLQKAFINTSKFATGIYHYRVVSGKQIIANGSFSKQ
jgi:hypothetical protein